MVTFETILVFGVKDTLSKRSKIKPIPYLRLKLMDRMNLPENFYATIEIYDGNKEESLLVSQVDGIRKKKVKIFSRKFKPETTYYVTVRLCLVETIKFFD